MNDIETIEGDFTAVAGGRYALIAARFNEAIVDALVKGAADALLRHGANPADIRVYRAPGALEIPLVAERLAAQSNQPGSSDAIIALGAVVRGSTPHFDIVARESAAGLSAVMARHGIPVTNGILTTDTIEQAIERAGAKAGNKGAAAALAAIEMVSLLKKLG